MVISQPKRDQSAGQPQKQKQQESESKEKGQENKEAKVEVIEEEKGKDVVLVSCKMNDIRWRFDFQYDYWNQGSKVHGISDNGRRFECNYNGYGWCYCFSSISSVCMACNSGIYKIKFKIDKIDNSYGYGNILGLTCDNFGSLDLGKYKRKHDGKNNYDWRENSFNWIGWSGYDKEDDALLHNGLYCGYRNSGRAGNIFRES